MKHLKDKIKTLFKSKNKNLISKKEEKEYTEFQEKVRGYFKSRRSIRKFSETPVDWETIYNIIEAAINAPCAGNVQNYKIIVIKDHKSKEKIAKIQSQQYWIADAPYLIAVVRDSTRLNELYPENGETYSIQNATAVVQNIIMLAHLHDLGACWTEAFDNNVIKEHLGINDNKVVDAIIAIGYPNEVPQIEKTPISEIVQFEKFGNRKPNN